MRLNWNGGRVTGAINAKQIRALWHEGRLYLALSPTDVRWFDVPELSRSNGKLTSISAHNLVLKAPCCGDRARKELSAMTIEQIIERAQVSADA